MHHMFLSSGRFFHVYNWSTAAPHHITEGPTSKLSYVICGEYETSPSLHARSIACCPGHPADRSLTEVLVFRCARFDPSVASQMLLGRSRPQHLEAQSAPAPSPVHLLNRIAHKRRRCQACKATNPRDTTPSSQVFGVFKGSCMLFWGNYLRLT